MGDFRITGFQQNNHTSKLDFVNSCGYILKKNTNMKYRNTSRIIRSDKKGKTGYTVISNSILQSKILNPVQKSMLVHLLSLKHDYVIRKTHIYKDMNVGRDAFNKAWDCLVELGYIIEKPFYEENLKCYHYDIYEEPVPVLLKSSVTEYQSDSVTVSIINNDLESNDLESNLLNNILSNYTSTRTGTSILGVFESEEIQRNNQILQARYFVEKDLSNSTYLKNDIFKHIAVSEMPNIEKKLRKEELEKVRPLIEN